MKRTATLVVLLSTVGIALAGSEWLEFNAGCPEGSEPLVQYNGDWDGFLTFDVELRGLLADTIEVDSVEYLRFRDTPGIAVSDETGYPELPVVRCFVWVPDDTDLSLWYAAACPEESGTLPVYPVPEDSVFEDSCSIHVGQVFRRDSTAYASIAWYPDTLVRLSGEFHLRDTRIAIVDVWPVQYLPAEDSIRVWSDIGVGLSWDAETADWSEADLGPYERMVRDRILGYTPGYSPINSGSTGQVARPANLTRGPGFVPDYVTVVAEGLDGSWIDDHADHRAALNGFDVAIVVTDDILSQFGGEAQALTPDIIRDFTEAMWEWSQPASKRPSYLLLIGDHEDQANHEEPWFLPSARFEWGGSLGIGANDEWYVYFGEDRSVRSAWPDMIVGRVPARTQADAEDMLGLAESFEAASSYPPPETMDWRRRITRLTGQNAVGTTAYPFDFYLPDSAWTCSLADWLGYDFSNTYAGDANPLTIWDGSDISSEEWVNTCISEFTEGQQVAFYADHGVPHFFSAGMDWSPGGPPAQGVPDSVFGTIEIRELCSQGEQHGYPLLFSMCCLNGRFDHTVAEHDQWGKYCKWPEAPHPYDYGIDCLAEAFVRNVEGGAIAVFAGSPGTGMIHYASWDGNGSCMACCFLRSIYYYGHSRTGDAIQAGRLEYLDHLLISSGSFNDNCGCYNLLGDPAVDIGDRVKFRQHCDLVISPDDLESNRYPTRSLDDPRATGLRVGVRNAGAQASGPFDVDLSIVVGQYSTDLTEECSGLDPGEEAIIGFTWYVPQSVDAADPIALYASADPEEECDDCWRANNEAEALVKVFGYYPGDEGWPVRLPGSVVSPPILCDVDGDGDLDVLAVTGTGLVVAVDPSNPAEFLWVSEPIGTGCIPLNPGIALPVLADVTGDDAPEVVIDGSERLYVLDAGDGSTICSYMHAPADNLIGDGAHTVAAADVVAGGHEEICVVTVDGASPFHQARLEILDVVSGELQLLDSEDLPECNTNVLREWVASADLTPDVSDETVVFFSWKDTEGRHSGLWLYDYDDVAGSGQFIDEVVWDDPLTAILVCVPALGDLLADGMDIALSRLYSASGHDPAFIVDGSDFSSYTSCQRSERDAGNILCCIMADWDPLVTGLDMVISPAENQCFCWDADGDHATGWPNLYEDLGAARPPFPALGDLDDDGWPDLVTAIGEGTIHGLDRNGVELRSLGFPYVLPSEICGGFAIADIDNDEKVELVFGTMDNYLHVWELGDCDEGYAPWPQCQHDAGRTGVLE